MVDRKRKLSTCNHMLINKAASGMSVSVDHLFLLVIWFRTWGQIIKKKGDSGNVVKQPNRNNIVKVHGGINYQISISGVQRRSLEDAAQGKGDPCPPPSLAGGWRCVSLPYMGKARPSESYTRFRVCVIRECAAGTASLSPLFHSFGSVALNKRPTGIMPYELSKSVIFSGQGATTNAAGRLSCATLFSSSGLCQVALS